MNSVIQNSAITLGQILVFSIPKSHIKNPYLSVPGWNDLADTKGYVRDTIRTNNTNFTDNFKAYRSYDEAKCIFPYKDHIQKLNLGPNAQWITIGARNLGNNLRIVGYKKDEKNLLQLEGEKADKNQYVEYTCLCMKANGELSIERISFLGGKPNQDDIVWAVSGQELIWDGKAVETDDEVYEKILPYTYDMRHIWRTKGSPIIEQNPSWMTPMANCFVKYLDKSPCEMKEKLLEEKNNFALERECHYLHSAIGILDENNLVIVQRHGKLEDVAKTLKHAGAERAIELDQGGSCGVMIGRDDSEQIIFSSHYFRPRATALLVFELNEKAIDKNTGKITIIDKSDLLPK